MLKYAKLINEETKECSVGEGTNIAYYQSIGMTEMEVEKGYNGKWYLLGHAPEKPQSLINQERINELQAYLTSTDWYAVRMAETGVAIPDDVVTARASAREEISTLRGKQIETNNPYITE